MSVYVIAGLNIHDEERYEDYATRALVSLEKYKVEVLVVSDAPVAVEGINPYRRYVVLKFPDQAAFDTWYRSAEYQSAIPIRHESAETGFFVTVNGLG